jgi:predicted Fe-S protein YdhL (DUF1289 family)
VCTLDPAARICIGCGRTLDEIAAWPTATPDAKRLILARIAEHSAQQRRPKTK